MSSGFEGPHDDPIFRPAPAPDDRLWRHPSEVAALVDRVERIEVPRRRIGVMWASIVLMAVTGIVVVALVASDSSTPSRRAVRALNVDTALPSTTLLLVSTTVPGAALGPALVDHGWLGISGYDGPGGVAVTEVDDGSPAELAGLRAGDVIVRVGTSTTPRIADLLTVLRTIPAGTTIDFQIKRTTLAELKLVKLGSSVHHD